MSAARAGILVAVLAVAVTAAWLARGRQPSPPPVGPATVATPHAGSAGTGSLEDAAAGLAARLRRAPDDPAGWELLARTYRELGRPTAAAAAAAAGRGAAARADNPVPTPDETAPRPAATTADDDAGIAELLASTTHDDADAGTWRRLGQALTRARRYEEALAALEHALVLAPDDPDLLVDSADLRAATHERRFDDIARSRLQRALALAPGNPKALWLLGSAALQAGQRDTAADLWQTLLGILPPGSGDAAIIRANLRDLGETAATGGREIRGHVALAPSLAASVAPDDTLFVFARAVEGPAMPLAVIRRRAADLPLDFTLDDSMAMQPGHSLSSASRVVLGARISRSGEAVARSGDLEGFSSPVPTASPPRVNILIDTPVSP